MNILKRYSGIRLSSLITKVLVFAISTICVLPVSAQSIKNSSDYNIFARKFTLNSLYLCRKFKCTFSSKIYDTLVTYDIGRKNSNPKIQVRFIDAINSNRIEIIFLNFDRFRNLTLSESEINEQLYRIFGVRKVWVLYCDSPYEGEAISLRYKMSFACLESSKEISYLIGAG